MAQNFRRSVAQHREEIVRIFASVLARRSGHSTELVSVYDAAARRTAEPTVAPRSLPAFDNSQMDGYAVRRADFGGERQEFRLAPVIPAGAAPVALGPGLAAPIMTGAMMPAGADAVVPIEAVIAAAGGPANVFPDFSNDEYLERYSVMLPKPPLGQFVRRAGSDVASGTLVIEAGTTLTPRHVGLLAALGVSEIVVERAPQILVLVTGDEVRTPGEELLPGQIYDSNSAYLVSSIREIGIDPARVSISTDTVTDFEQRLDEALNDYPNAIAVITTGGISKGAFEVVKVALEQRGVEFGSVAMQPGGPQGCGVLEGGHREEAQNPVALVSFPGNPVSTAISFEMFLRPILVKVFGSNKHVAPRTLTEAVLKLDGAGQSVSSPLNKSQWRRGIVSTDSATGKRHVSLIGSEQSHLVFALAQANALVNIPEGVDIAHHGDVLKVLMLEEG